jgi:hypothetical protein
MEMFQFLAHGLGPHASQLTKTILGHTALPKWIQNLFWPKFHARFVADEVTDTKLIPYMGG